MAEVGTVYDATPAPRTPGDILPATDDGRRDAKPGPPARNKWLTASVIDDAASVVGQIFDEADRRDPDHRRSWVALVDGNNHQIDRIAAQARARTVPVTIIIDFIHVLEYLWKATWCFHTEGDPAAEPRRSSPEAPPASPAPSDAPPPWPAWNPPAAPAPTPAPPT
jgi:hypothetical protein